MANQPDRRPEPYRLLAVSTRKHSPTPPEYQVFLGGRLPATRRNPRNNQPELPPASRSSLCNTLGRITLAVAGLHPTRRVPASPFFLYGIASTVSLVSLFGFSALVSLVSLRPAWFLVSLVSASWPQASSRSQALPRRPSARLAMFNPQSLSMRAFDQSWRSMAVRVQRVSGTDSST